jgi:ADP-ribose pyrophosphatase YjhB (NUDIX family)
MSIPEFVVEMRKLIGQQEMWLPAVTAVVQRGDEILLVQRADNGLWTLITGILDPGEEPAVAAARETLEETGVVITVDRLASTSSDTGIVHVNGDRASYLDLTFSCTYVSGEAHVADDESRDVRWFPRDGLPDMPEKMVRRLADALSGEQAARFVWPT